MKKHLFILVVVMFGNYTFAGNTTATMVNSTVTSSAKLISGKVIDKISGEEIAGAEIQIGEKKVFTDLNGNFSAVVPTDINSTKVEAAVSYISYKEACITIDLFSYNPLVIEIVSK
jgi:hypothetical protein